MSQLEQLALRMARARRQMLDSKKRLKLPDISAQQVTREFARLSESRIEWRKASSALWRLVAKMDAKS